MCGFAGVLAWSVEWEVRQELLARMSHCIAHRGPDGEAFFFNHYLTPIPDRPQIALAFRRLAVLDPDPRAMQPMVTFDRSHAIVFNGEIYNFKQLRSELTSLHPQYNWKTTGDTEVLLLALITWGEKALNKLNGMFAIAFWDQSQQTLLLVRDRMGQKPLYFAQTQYGCAFASELSAIQEVSGIDKGIDQAALCDYLRFGVVGAGQSILKGVRCVRPGEWLKISCPIQEVARQSYFDCNKTGTANGDAKSLVQQAVERQLVSDVPLGVFLSGGIDSSIIASCAQRVGKIKTFSIGFDDPRYDESKYATEVATHLGTDHHTFRVTPDAAHDLPLLASVFAEPFADSSALPTHYLSRETRKHVTVALSGDGGDELFGGYDRYRAMAWSGSQWLKPLAPLGVKLSGRHPKSFLARAGRFLKSTHLPEAERYTSYLRFFDEYQVKRLLRRDLSPAMWLDRWEGLRATRDSVQTAIALDRLTYLPDDLLTKVDRASMLHALEVRNPFMDHELVQFAAGLSREQLFKGGKKRLLREAFAADLPVSVFKRRKMGFAIPIGSWLSTHLKDLLHDSLFSRKSFIAEHMDGLFIERLCTEHHAGKCDHGQRLYALLMLELWWQTQSVR